MTLARSGLRSICAIRCAFVIGAFFALSAAVIFSAQWDREGARLALEKAQNLQVEISSASEPTTNQYLSCIRSYRLVYMKDPHFSGSDDAIYASGLLYEEMGRRFGKLDYYRSSARLFEFLISDYDTSPFCPDALLRLGNLYRGPLEDNDAAEEAFQMLRTRFKNSNAAHSLTDTVSAIPVRDQPQQAPAPLEGALAKTAPPEIRSTNSSVIHGIRFWTTDEYTRVVIDMDSETRYTRARLFSPDRVYFDISNAQLNPDLHAKTFEVGDEFIKRIRLGKNQADVVRVVLDLESVKDYSVSELYNPFRIIIDIHGNRPALAKLERLPNESKPRSDEMAAENLKNQSENAKKTVIQQQAQYTPKEIVASPAAPVTENRPAAKQIEKVRPSTAESASSSVTPAAKSPLPAISTIAKEAGENKPADSSQPPVKAEAKPSLEAKTPETGTPAPDAKSAPSTGAAEVTENSPNKLVDSAPTSGGTEGKPPLDAKHVAAGAPTSALKSAPVAKIADVAEANLSKPADVPPVVKPSPIPAPKAASPTSIGERTLTRILGLKVGRIVIDPGHGGHDTGTIGRGGLMEKDLALEVAKDLRQQLESRLDIDVVLTREEDVFLSLEERTTIANQYQADLFVSIHANSSSARSTSGVETYFLDFAKNSAAREIAARENASSLGNLRDLEDLIKRIAQAEKSAESRELAAIIQKKLFTSVRQILPSTRNRGVRSAPFVVLIGANMPSVLAEVAFISNPRDESMLKKKESQEQLAKALFSGIEGYMKTLGSDVAQNKARTN